MSPKQTLLPNDREEEEEEEEEETFSWRAMIWPSNMMNNIQDGVVARLRHDLVFFSSSFLLLLIVDWWLVVVVFDCWLVGVEV